MMLAVIGLAVAALALPRLVAAVISMPADVVAFDIRHDRPVSLRALTTMVESDASAQEWHQSPGRLREIAIGSLRLAVGEPDASQARRERLEAALAASTAALLHAPADPYMWIARGTAAHLLGQEPAAARAALAATFVAGRYEPELYAQRVSLALALWESLDTNERAQAGEAARAIASRDVAVLAGLGHDLATRNRVMELLANQAMVRDYLHALVEAIDGPSAQ